MMLKLPDYKDYSFEQRHWFVADLGSKTACTLRPHQYFPCGLSTFHQLIRFPSIRQKKHCEVANLNFALLNPVKDFETSPFQIFVCGNIMGQVWSA